MQPGPAGPSSKVGAYLRQNVLGLTAIFVALSGTTYAATQLPPGSVGTPQLQNSAVTSSKVKNGSLGRKDIQPGSFAPAKLLGKPSSDFSAGNVASNSCVLGEVKLIAGNTYPSDTVPADGRTLDIGTYSLLFSLLHTDYGGNGSTTFAVPDLRGAEPRGRGPHGVHYVICTSGIYP